MGYPWFRAYSAGLLRGSIVAQMTLEEQMVWVKLLAFASECRDRGIIRRAKGIPFEQDDLAHQLGVPEYLLASTISKCIADENADDPRTRIMVLPDGSLQIGNWEHYQSKSEKAIAKEQAIAQTKDTKRRQQTAVDALIRTVNRLNQGLAKRRYELTEDGEHILDTQTGEIKEVKENNNVS